MKQALLGTIPLACAALVACSQESAKLAPAAPATAVAAAEVATASPDPGADAINPRLLRRFQPLPEVLGTPKGAPDPAQVDLGRMLFFDKRLSKNGDLSCNSCHVLSDYGVDHKPTSTGHGGNVGRRNSPTVYNAAGFFSQFWDGRAADLEAQAKGPMLNPIEMAMPDGAHVVAALKAVRGYDEPFRRAFPGEADPLTFDNVARAIGTFERGLMTPGRWDKFLLGDATALSTQEKEGLKTFLNTGCMVCHTGPFLGGSMFERVGVVEPWPNQGDKGRAEVTKIATDAMMFKVPTLRNVDKTAPYFHDGSVATLPDAVRMMAKHQLGLMLDDQEVTQIVSWLESLTGELPQAYITPPVLPR